MGIPLRELRFARQGAWAYVSDSTFALGMPTASISPRLPKGRRDRSGKYGAGAASISVRGGGRHRASQPYGCTEGTSERRPPNRSALDLPAGLPDNATVGWWAAVWCCGRGGEGRGCHLSSCRGRTARSSSRYAARLFGCVWLLRSVWRSWDTMGTRASSSWDASPVLMRQGISKRQAQEWQPEPPIRSRKRRLRATCSCSQGPV